MIEANQIDWINYMPKVRTSLRGLAAKDLQSRWVKFRWYIEEWVANGKPKGDVLSQLELEHRKNSKGKNLV